MDDGIGDGVEAGEPATAPRGAPAGAPTVLVVDVANVMGSRPDGWWRDRHGAATRLLAQLAPLLGTEVQGPGPDAAAVGRRLSRIIAVVEGRARSASAPDGIEVVRAASDGDSAVVHVATALLRDRVDPGSSGGGPLDGVLVVTADRALRRRLPAGCDSTGPSWLLAQLG